MTARPGAKIRRLHTISWSYFHGLADFEVGDLDVLLAVSPWLHPDASYGVGALYPPLGGAASRPIRRSRALYRQETKGASAERR